MCLLAFDFGSYFIPRTKQIPSLLSIRQCPLSVRTEQELKKKVVIVGGGYAGVGMAHSLDKYADVTLIEPREAFFHSVAAIRAVVQPDLLDRLIIPYDRLLKRGKVIRARAKQISEGHVVLEDGGTVEGDIVIAATGSNYAQPFKPWSESIADFRSKCSAPRSWPPSRWIRRNRSSSRSISTSAA